jgi:hypothetical protein
MHRRSAAWCGGHSEARLLFVNKKKQKNFIH